MHSYDLKLNSKKKEILTSYKNGDYDVTLYKDGTLERATNETNPHLEYPTSLDVKITNYCDMGCGFCHEKSTTQGEHANKENLLEVLSELPGGQELALGGGNPMSYPEIGVLLERLKDMGFISNMTMHQGHMKKHLPDIQYFINNSLLYGIGVSVTSLRIDYLKMLKPLEENLVFHVINGIFNPDDLATLAEEFPKSHILVLGYKNFGFGVDYSFKHYQAIGPRMEHMVREVYNQIGNINLSFDNLAIEQLHVKRLFTGEGWKQFYMGDDFEFTMYIDGVNEEFAPTSRSSDRAPFNYGLLSFFKNE